MIRPSLILLTCASLPGCNIEVPEVIEPDCDARVLYYADADGWADQSTGVLACEAVASHLTESESTGWDCDDAEPTRTDDCGPQPGDTGTTGDTGDTGDTGGGTG